MQDVHYYCSVEVLIKNLILPILLFFVKCTAHFACIIAYFFSLPILLKILLANFVKAYSLSAIFPAMHEREQYFNRFIIVTFVASIYYSQ